MDEQDGLGNEVWRLRLLPHTSSLHFLWKEVDLKLISGWSFRGARSIPTYFKECLCGAGLQIKWWSVLSIVNPWRKCTTFEPFKVATLVLDPQKQFWDVRFVNRLE